MSEENVRTISAVYEPLNEGDWEGVFRDAHPNFEITTQRGPTAGTYRGQQAVKEQVQDLLAAFETWTVEPEAFFEGGDHVVVFVEVRLRPKGATADMEVRNGHLWTIRDGTITSLQTFPVRDEALEAAGLSR
jgi:ketosteroid isomerase-like protein